MKSRALSFALFAVIALGGKVWSQAGGGSNSDQPLLGDAHYERNPRVVWEAMQENDEIKKIYEVLGSRHTWVRNNVLKDEKYVADRAVLKVEADGPSFKFETVEKGSEHSRLVLGDEMYLWAYSEVGAEWTRHLGSDIRRTGIYVSNRTLSQNPNTTLTSTSGSTVPAIMKEAEGQYRFPIKIVPARQEQEEFDEARLVLRGNDVILYLLRPGTDTYLEEWVLQS